MNYLFPNKYKKIGWLILIPSMLIGLAILVLEYEPEFLDFNIPSIFIFESLSGEFTFKMINNNILNELLMILVIVSSLFVGFSKEKEEDEYISKIRLESLVWAVYVNYGILLISALFLFDFSFLWVMILNMFTVLFFFIIKFNWKVHQIKKTTNYEE